MSGRIISQSHPSSSSSVEGLRVCKCWVRGERVCVIFYVDSNYEIFLVDRDSEDNVESYVRPSLRISHDFGSFNFCVVDGILYAFRIRINLCSSEEEEIFKVKLSPPGIQFADLLEKVPFMCKPKSEGLPLVWGKKILLFSTLITFYDCVPPEQRVNTFDFEVFDPSTLQSVLLPPLLISRPERSGELIFYNKVTLQWEELPVCGVCSFPYSFFSIESYGFDDLHSRFSIQTEFGHMFSIDLNMQYPSWSLGGYGGDIKKFTRPGLNFIYSYGPRGTRRALVDTRRVLVDASGVNYTSGLGNSRRTIYYPFPLSAFEWYRSAINVLDRSPSMLENIYGIVRVGRDASCCRDEYVGPTNLDWCLDVLRIDATGDPMSDYEFGPHVEIMKSWKFRTVDKHVVGARFIGLYPY